MSLFQPTTPTVREEHVVLPLSEVFVATVHGEGPYTGRRCFFVRLGRCNLHCDFCDTPFTWRDDFDPAVEYPDTPTEEIVDLLVSKGAQPGDMVVLSGGEPLMQHKRLLPLLSRPYSWHVETNGTIPPPSWWTEHVIHTSVSPKLITHDSDPLKKRIKPVALSKWRSEERRVGKEGRARWAADHGKKKASSQQRAATDR